MKLLVRILDKIVGSHQRNRTGFCGGSTFLPGKPYSMLLVAQEGRHCASPLPPAAPLLELMSTNKRLGPRVPLQRSVVWPSAPNFVSRTLRSRWHLPTPASTPSPVLTPSTIFPTGDGSLPSGPGCL